MDRNGRQAGRLLLLVGVLLAACSIARAEEPRDMSLAELLDRARQPSGSLDHTVVVSEGYLLQTRWLPPTDRKGRGPQRLRLWLGPDKPTHPAAQHSRIRSVVATASPEVVRDSLGDMRAVESLMGSRLRLTGVIAFSPSHRGELKRSRGTLWEFVEVRSLLLCPDDRCPAPPEDEDGEDDRDK